jgi:hypothetical protein
MKLPKINIDKLGNIVLIIVCVIYLKNCGSVTEVEVIPDGYISPKEFDYRMDVIRLLKQNQSLEHEIRNFKNKYEKDTIIINNSNKHELRDMFSKHIYRR